MNPVGGASCRRGSKLGPPGSDHAVLDPGQRSVLPGVGHGGPIKGSMLKAN